MDETIPSDCGASAAKRAARIEDYLVLETLRPRCGVDGDHVGALETLDQAPALLENPWLPAGLDVFLAGLVANMTRTAGNVPSNHLLAQVYCVNDSIDFSSEEGREGVFSVNNVDREGNE